MFKLLPFLKRNNAKKDSFPAGLFISASLLCLLLLGSLLTVADYQIHSLAAKKDGHRGSGHSLKNLYINKQYSDDNPFVTKVPQLEDMLKGPILDENDPFLGDSGAPVTIVEFADYKCDICYKQEKKLKKIKQEYKDKIRFIWKDYPASEPDSPSFKAARAARCAGRQDAFWEYHSELYDDPSPLNRDAFLKIARRLNLDTNSFKKCLNDKRVDGLILDNIKEANALRITGIPFIYVNNQQIMGKASYEELKRLIEIEMGE